jgi:hypothetical protein
LAYHIDCIQKWDDFSYRGQSYSLKHLSSHQLTFKGQKRDYEFVITYGLHCFTKNDTPYSISISYSDVRETRCIDLERYNASKYLKGILGNIANPEVIIHETTKDKYFTIDVLNNMNGSPEPYKICLAAFKENRLLRMHVITAYFVREGEGSPDNPVSKKGFSFFKLATDVQKLPRNARGPKEAFNRN